MSARWRARPASLRRCSLTSKRTARTSGNVQLGTFLMQTIQAARYEMLFESGIVAMLSNFYREAVTSFAVALERFYDYAVRVLVEHAKIPPDELEAAWKMVAKKSERQLGAFLFLHAFTFQRAAFDETQRKAFEKWTTFRNDVTHNGVLPSQEETLKWAEWIYTFLRTTAKSLQATCGEAVEAVGLRSQLEAVMLAQRKAIAKYGEPTPDAEGYYPGVAGGWVWKVLNDVGPDEPDTFEHRLKLSVAHAWRWGIGEN